MDEEFVEEVKAGVRAAAAALRRDAFAPKPAAATCGRFDFARMCSAGSAMVS